ncbi:MAG: sensor domain-containing diguanylate cyclase [Deltaproteobacteria bacterium]|nr:sensor domain-containing diguanylate cyclase [Deltaproteobacteria bacterium]
MSRFRTLADPETTRELVRNVREGVYITDVRGQILDANPAFLELFGFPSLEVLRRTGVQDLIIDVSRRQEELALLEKQFVVRDFELQVRRSDGAVLTVLDSCYAVQDPETGDTLFHGILIDITRHKEMESRLHELTVRDPLTGCYNRRHLAELEARLEREEAEWGVVLVDINDFRAYNDRHGHPAGDRALVELARFLDRHVRATSDAVFRMGGDEFMVLLSEGAPTATIHIVQRLREPTVGCPSVSFAIGWAVRKPRERLSQTIARADRDLILVRVRERAPEDERRLQR